MQETIRIRTQGRSTIDITAKVEKFVSQSGVENGLCNLFIQHTSASLIFCENADPDVRSDLENFMQQIIRDGDPLFRHRAEGSDDMPAHIKSALTNNQLTLSIKNGKIILGIWQGLYLFEHRLQPQKRIISHHFIGEQNI